jgi:transposase
MTRKSCPTLLPDASCLQLMRLETDEQSLVAIVETNVSEALCPLCQCRSESIHSRYTRVVADLPWAGWAVRLELHVRRFFCQNKECKRRIFTERLPGVVAPSARRTTRLTDLLTLIGFAMGGEAGNCLVERMGLEASPETLLQLVRKAEERQGPTPRVLGINDFSFCRRRSYGAMLIDLEQRMPIDLLPDREAETFKKWLLAHPGVEIISRDRGGAFAEGARQGAPKARQIADRWHILSNLSDALQGFFLAKQPLLKALTSQPEAEAPAGGEQPEPAPWYTGMTKRTEEKSQRLHQQRVELYHQIHGLAAKKVDVANRARQLRVSRQTIYTYLQMKQPPERTRINQEGQRLIDPYKDYLIRRWNEGCRNAELMRDKLSKVNPVTRDERRCYLPCGPTKSTTGVKAKTSAPSHSAPHRRDLDIPWCVTSNPPGGDAERAAADGRHTTTGLAHGRQDGGTRGLPGDSSRKAPCPPTWWCYEPSCCASRRACSSTRSRTSACHEALR